MAGTGGDGPRQGGVLPADVSLVGGLWRLGQGYEERPSTTLGTNEVGASRLRPFVPSEVEGRRFDAEPDSGPHVVAIDYGSKRNIFRNLADAGARVTVLPATATFEEVMAHHPDGFFLSNGPGDPAATGEYAVPVIRSMLETASPCSASASATSCSPSPSARAR